VNPATIAAVAESAARLISFIPEAAEALNSVLGLWSTKHGLDEHDLLRQVQSNLRDKFGMVDSRIDERLASLRLPKP